MFESILNYINTLIGNYGWSVVVFTALIRLVLLPLDIKSKKSMRAMSRVQPKMQELQKKYAQDKDKLNKKMSELYKKEHVNPLMGCLPMLIQLPILFIMFGAIRDISQMKTGEMLVDLMEKLKGCANLDDVGGIGKVATEGWLWVKNVFQPDSFGQTILPSFQNALNALKTANIDTSAYEGLSQFYNHYMALNYGSTLFHAERVIFFTISFPTTLKALTTYANGLLILPVSAGLSQWLMTKLTSSGQPQTPQDPNNPNPMDMNSGLMKWFFPLFSVFICITSNAAFAVYWMTANILQIVQQLIINWYFARKDKKDAALAAESPSDEIE